jgi:aspartyl-tRNA(Asn)/glutamyl-tRNA(Gln) amidotransferase subunit B
MYHPICVGGGVRLRSGKFIRLNRIHSEEDAGKLTHDDINEITLVDYNRCGAPLIEMVTEPDFSSAAEAVEFLEEVRSRLIYSGVANCKMEEGGMRCDVNISLKPTGAVKLGNRVELKNLNSWKMVARSIEYEIKRQTNLLDDGKRITMETRKWNDGKGTTTAMRNKEGAVDYRYFPDPDQYPIHISHETVDGIRKNMPKLAEQYRADFVSNFGLPKYDADILTREKNLTDFYLECVSLFPNPVEISKWILTHLLAKTQNYNVLISPKQFTDIMRLTDTKKISRTNAVVLIDEIWDKTDDAESLAGKLKMTGGIDRAELTKIIDGIFSANPNAINDYQNTPDKVINFYMGQTMKATKGLADSTTAKEIILKRLS